MTTITRALAVQEVTDTRTFTGLAAPYGEVIEYDGKPEMFAQGAFEGAIPVKLYLDHTLLEGKQAIGVVEAYNDTEAGLEITARFYETEEAEEVYQALKRGDLTDLSISGVPSKHHETEDGVTVYEAIELLEISVVQKGAYPSAKISVVRSKDSETSAQDNTNNREGLHVRNMELENKVNELSETVEVLERGLESMRNKEDDTPKQYNIRSYGEFAKGLNEGNEDALMLQRAWAGGVLADVKYAPTWVADLTKIAEKPRVITNAFSRMALPGDGSTVDWVELKSDTTQAAVQANEGDDIVYGNVSVQTKQAGFVTIAAGSDISRQALERNQVNALDLTYRALVNKYANLAESRVVTAFNGAAAGTITGTGYGIDTYAKVVKTFVEASKRYTDMGASLDFVVVNHATFVALAQMSETGTPILDRTNGSVNIMGISGSIFGVPVVVADVTAPITFASKDAIVTFESGGPSELKQENIGNLTVKLAVYGYQSITVPQAGHLLRLGA